MIESCIMAVGTAPRGANHQRQHFVAIQNSDMKERVGAEWLRALEPIGTDKHKLHLIDAPWLIIVFAQRYGMTGAGVQFKNYYFSEKYENCDEHTNHSTVYGRAGSHTVPNEVLSSDVYAT